MGVSENASGNQGVLLVVLEHLAITTWIVEPQTLSSMLHTNIFVPSPFVQTANVVDSNRGKLSGLGPIIYRWHQTDRRLLPTRPR